MEIKKIGFENHLGIGFKRCVYQLALTCINIFMLTLCRLYTNNLTPFPPTQCRHESVRMKRKILKDFFAFVSNYYYIFVIPLLSIAVFFVSQYLTRGISYFIGKNGIKWGFLSFMAILQFFVSIMITWSVLSAFSSDFLSEYETIKMTSIIIIGGAPFNITILVWVALKLETYRLMKKRYGKEFKDDTFFQKIEDIERKEDESIKEAIKEKKTKDKDGLDFAST